MRILLEKRNSEKHETKQHTRGGVHIISSQVYGLFNHVGAAKNFYLVLASPILAEGLGNPTTFYMKMSLDSEKVHANKSYSPWKFAGFAILQNLFGHDLQ